MKEMLIAVLLCGPAQALDFGASGRGTAAASFLKLAPGARTASMGGAFSAMSEGAEAVDLNPAALARIARRSATFSHGELLGSRMEYAAFGAAWRRFAWGTSLRYASPGTLEAADAATGLPSGEFHPYDLAVSVAGAWQVRDFAVWPAREGAAVGLAGRYIQSRVLDSARTAALDAGAVAPPLFDGKLSVAATIRNLGGSLRYETREEELPLEFRLGSAWRDSRWTAGADAAFPGDDTPFLAAGGELSVPLRLPYRSLWRLGWNSRGVGDVPDLTGFSIGVGLGAGRGRLDYAVVPSGDQGLLHRVSVGADF